MDLSSFVSFFTTYKWTILFYAVVITLIVAFRSRFEWHGVIGLYKTQWGVKLMELLGVRFRKAVIVLSYIGIVVGFLAMLFIVYQVGLGLWKLFFVAGAPPVISPVLPGFKIPGMDLHVPLVTGLIALFFVVVIHEFSHGVVCKAHGVPVKSSGLLILGPIAGAFVEPDEKKLAKKPFKVQTSMYAAGPFSNIITAIILIPIMLGLTFFYGSMYSAEGASLTNVTSDSPAAIAGLEPGMVITSVDGTQVRTQQDLSEQLTGVRPGQEVMFGVGDEQIVVTTAVQPDDADSNRGYFGIFMGTEYEAKHEGWWFAPVSAVVDWLFLLTKWVFLLSLGLGLANLLPIGPIDGGRMVQLAAREVTGDEKRGDAWWRNISIVALVVVLVAFLVPILRAMF
jgi:membrane-associated protease RseP (regulator of RpoE activity)